jgi:hypothetical protein
MLCLWVRTSFRKEESLGVTHDQDGRVVQRLSVSTKVSIGLPPNSVNGSSATEGAVGGSPSDTIPAVTTPQVTTKPLPPENSSARNGRNGYAKPPTAAAASPPATNGGNGSAVSSGFNQLRNDFLTAARRVATTKKQAIGEVVEWASGGTFKYGDIGRMTEGELPRLRAATELMAAALASAAR